jgi:hypothetical protein
MPLVSLSIEHITTSIHVILSVSQPLFTLST